MREDWRFARIKHGAQFVNSHGEVLMLLLPVVSWDSLHLVRRNCMKHMHVWLYSCFMVSEAVAFGEARFGAGVGPIHLTQVQCTGEEADLKQCLSSNVTDECLHSMDVGIICSGTLGSCETAGFTSCCDSLQSDCSNNGCFCDPPCFVFNDCCDDVDKLCKQFVTDG